jgi:solute carrier family 25 S-adenosylmethionine transporter 26
MHESMGGAFRSIVKVDGFKGLYNGYSSLIMREVPFDMMQFMLYEQLKRQMKIYRNGIDLTAVDNMICGSIAGGVTAVCTTPLDVIKTRLMLQSGTNAIKYQVSLLPCPPQCSLPFLTSWTSIISGHITHT